LALAVASPEAFFALVYLPETTSISLCGSSGGWLGRGDLSAQLGGSGRSTQIGGSGGQSTQIGGGGGLSTQIGGGGGLSTQIGGGGRDKQFSSDRSSGSGELAPPRLSHISI
jgi:hypothetical protein